MDNEHKGRFIKQIIGAYPAMKLEPETLEVWGRHMDNIDYDLAIKRLDRHIATSKFPPSIAEILNPEEAGRRKQRPQESDGHSPAAIMNGGYMLYNEH